MLEDRRRNFSSLPHFQAGDEFGIVFEDFLGRLIEGIFGLNCGGENDAVALHAEKNSVDDQPKQEKHENLICILS